MQRPSTFSGLTPHKFFLKKPALKKFLIFSPKKAFLIFRETEISYIFSKKGFVFFREMELSCLKIEKFQQETFPAGKVKKKTLHIGEMEISSPKL